MARGLSLVLLAVGAWAALHAASTLFAVPASAPATAISAAGLRGGRVAMNAEKVDALLPMRKEFSTGASNEVSIVTPTVSSEDIKAYFSLNIIFFGIMMIFTAGGLVELLRFFPDAMLF
eukprot:CAMPEP_0170594276 /NCGR_PEP_ID=MMETSP0224-20130122/13912_1 /TAXON_ID=285029 /ORGANISM="Togula jolla, Strain CCCM 725" /LENGTH=118 /DNA_ID=CAMNT_0010918319 /DNA_START=56 /DNA_END=412 /DNA_ORIENTATION=+